MSTMTAKMSSISTKFQVGAAAFAVAGASALMPGAVANAAPVAPVPLHSLGASLGECDESDAGDCDNPLAGAIASSSVSATEQPAICNSLVCIGEGLTEAQNILVLEWNLIPLLPEAIQPLFFGFWESVIPTGFTACLFGATAKINQYSTVTVGATRGCSG